MCLLCHKLVSPAKYKWYYHLMEHLGFCFGAQDAKPLEVYSVEFMVDNNQLGFLGKVTLLKEASQSTFSLFKTVHKVARESTQPLCNISYPPSLFQCQTETRTCPFTCTYQKVSATKKAFSPKAHFQTHKHNDHILSPSTIKAELCSTAKESFGGMRLLRRADFNVGAHVNAFWRMPCRGALDKKSLTWDNKHITWFGKGSKFAVYGTPSLSFFRPSHLEFKRQLSDDKRCDG